MNKIITTKIIRNDNKVTYKLDANKWQLTRPKNFFLNIEETFKINEKLSGKNPTTF